ncbi:Hypothetical predicted protein [Mytilus galloprovincialis]|uniref:Apple domain-containing protein n=1 Tax=Mytilus galloprovincialis TaxID=29158 RepID=A0A8B6CB17_MYTGA|nr:Hypothetical predicted protein [Mytilus galloprovincialis]
MEVEHLLIAVGVISSSNIVFANDPTCLWPLDSSSFTTEIQVSPTDPVDTGQCGRIFGGQPPDYPNLVFELDGLIPVDLVVDATIESDKDYSFSMMVRPSVDTGALLHYKPDDSTQQLQELALYISGGYIYMERILDSNTAETSPQLTQQKMQINTWYFISFGIDISNGKMFINLNGDNIPHDKSYRDSVNFVIPGILRVGGMFDQRNPNLQGRVACVAFYSDVKEPAKDDSESFCKAGTWTNNEPDCSTPQAVQRSETAAGYFMMETNIQLNTLNQISAIPKCTNLRCAASCLRHQSCWYYRYEPSASGCSQCTLYDSSVTSWKGTGAEDNFLYKWK